MQVSKRFISNYSNMFRYLLIRLTKIGFHQWIIQKYKRDPLRVLGFPTLLFLRPLQSVTTQDQKNVVIYPIQVTLNIPTLRSQTVFRELHNERLVQLKMPLYVTNLISTTAATRQVVQTVHNPQDQIIPKSSISWNNKQKASLLSITVVQTEIKRLSGKVENLEEQLDKSNTNFRFQKVQSPMELSYLMPSFGKPNTVFRPVRQNEEPVLFEKPIVGVQSPPPTSRTPDIDINRLTDQVYQALERKIRLEKQRRGYR